MKQEYQMDEKESNIKQIKENRRHFQTNYLTSVD